MPVVSEVAKYDWKDTRYICLDCKKGSVVVKNPSIENNFLLCTMPYFRLNIL